MSIGIATLGMFNPESITELSTPLKVSLNNPNLICTLKKTTIHTSISAIKAIAKTQDTKLAITINRNKLKLVVK